MSFTPIHKQLLIKAYTKTYPKTLVKGKQMLLELVAEIGMTPVTKPQCVNVTERGNEGPTGSINLATSHIAWHYWTKSNLLMMDVYSCAEFDENVVLECLDKYFKFKSISTRIIDRDTMQIISERELG